MLVVLPVRDLVLYTAVGMSTYSLVVFLMTLGSDEMQFIRMVLNAMTVGMGCCVILNLLSTPCSEEIEEAEEADEADEADEEVAEEADEADEEVAEAEEEAEEAEEADEAAEEAEIATKVAMATKTAAEEIAIKTKHYASECVVEEKDGKLFVTVVYTPISEMLEKADEVREMVEKSLPHETPLEETSEFADLLRS